MPDSPPIRTLDALEIARGHVVEPPPPRRGAAGALAAAAMAALGGLASAWIVVLGPSLAEPPSAEPVRALIAAPASASGLGTS